MMKIKWLHRCIRCVIGVLAYIVLGVIIAFIFRIFSEPETLTRSLESLIKNPHHILVAIILAGGSILLLWIFGNKKNEEKDSLLEIIYSVIYSATLFILFFVSTYLMIIIKLIFSDPEILGRIFLEPLRNDPHHILVAIILAGGGIPFFLIFGNKNNKEKYELSRIIYPVIYCAVFFILLFIRCPGPIKEFFRNGENINVENVENGDNGDNLELFNLTYEFLLITVVGGGIALLWDQLNKERDRREKKRDYLRQMYSELLSAYNQAKQVRRRLQALCDTRKKWTPGTTININHYDEQMDLLSDAQLIFEVYTKTAQKEKDKTKAKQKLLWFVSKPEDLWDQLNKIQEYLNHIIIEYAKERKESVENGTYKIEQLNNLKDFIGPYHPNSNSEDRNRKFNTEFKQPMNNIREIILQEISLKEDSPDE